MESRFALAAARLSLPTARSMVFFTSSGVISLPLLNLTPLRMWIFQVTGSTCSHLSASTGVSFIFSSMVVRHSEAPARARLQAFQPSAGSRLLSNQNRAMFICFAADFSVLAGAGFSVFLSPPPQPAIMRTAASNDNAHSKSFFIRFPPLINI